jgi:hypothetical protein
MMEMLNAMQYLCEYRTMDPIAIDAAVRHRNIVSGDHFLANLMVFFISCQLSLPIHWSKRIISTLL